MNDWASALAPPLRHGRTHARGAGSAARERWAAAAADVGHHFGVEGTFRRTPVGVFFGKAGTKVPDPYFGGEGPERTGCTFCGACMVGCREGAKNTLLKNYLWFAEKRGVEILPEREVVDIRPIGAQDGSEGYVVTTQRPGAWFRKQRRTFSARGIVMSAGALGSNRLLAKCKLGGSLPAHQRSPRAARAHQQRVDPRVTLPEGVARPWNDVATQLEHPHEFRHAHRVRHLWQARRHDGAALHAVDGRRQPGHPAADVARQTVLRHPSHS